MGCYTEAEMRLNPVWLIGASVYHSHGHEMGVIVKVGDDERTVDVSVDGVIHTFDAYQLDAKEMIGKLYSKDPINKKYIRIH